MCSEANLRQSSWCRVLRFMKAAGLRKPSRPLSRRSLGHYMCASVELANVLRANTSGSPRIGLWVGSDALRKAGFACWLYTTASASATPYSSRRDCNGARACRVMLPLIFADRSAHDHGHALLRRIALSVAMSACAQAHSDSQKTRLAALLFFLKPLRSGGFYWL